MPLAAVSLLSAGVIGYEILLMRLFSIVQWHHFAFMIISIALLGFGASGTFLAFARDWLLARFTGAWQINAVAFGVTSLAGFAFAERLPFNALEAMWEPRQFAYVGVTYLLLMVPFFCAANCIGLAFMRFPERPGRVYRFDLMGAGIGAAGIMGALFVLPPEAGLNVMLGVGLLAAAVAGAAASRARSLALGAAAVVLPLIVPASWTALEISEFKGISRALRVPGTEVLHRASSPLGLVTVVASPTIPFRHVPGLSLNAQIEPPEQLGVFTDGDGLSVITRHRGKREDLAYLDYTTAASPYHLLEAPRVAILGAGAGAEVLLALYHRASRVDAVEVNPEIVKLVRDRFAEFAGQIYAAPHIRVHIAEARSFVAASNQGYDLIQLPILESLGAAGGPRGLSETYVYTVEALGDYLGHLVPGGLLAISSATQVPPRDALKHVATAIAALERAHVAEPGRHMAMIRGSMTTTLLVKKNPLTATELSRIREFARERSFDLAYLPDVKPDEANRYNVLARPYDYEGAVALLGPDRRSFLERYKFDLRPATDDRPYFFDFFKWRALPELLAMRRQGTMALIEWSTIILIVTLAQAALLSALLIVAPLGALRTRRTPMHGLARVVVYFLALGLAFLFLEIAFIQRLTLFLGHPLYSVAVVLAAFLLFAGAGAGLSARLGALRPAGTRLPMIVLVVGGITVVAVAYLYLLPLLLAALMPLPVAAKVAVALALIAPLAFLMGMPFPLGLMQLSERAPQFIPWAWGINGCASVIGAVMAMLLAVQFGFSAVVGLAVVLYAGAALAFHRPLAVPASR